MKVWKHLHLSGKKVCDLCCSESGDKAQSLYQIMWEKCSFVQLGGNLHRRQQL